MSTLALPAPPRIWTPEYVKLGNQLKLPKWARPWERIKEDIAVESTYVQSNGASFAGSSAPAVTLGAAPTVGNFLAVFLYVESGTGTPTMTTTGFTAGTVTNDATHTQTGRVFWKFADGTETATLTGASGGNLTCGIVAVEYSSLSSENAETRQGNASTTKNTGSVTPTAGITALAICFRGIKNTAVMTNPVASGTNSGTVNIRFNGSGTAPAMATWDFPITKTSGSYSSSWTDGSFVNMGEILIASEVILTPAIKIIGQAVKRASFY